jgi:hypothetical protein
MAEKKGEKQSDRNLKPDEIVEKVAPDAHPDVVRIVGRRIGRSTQPDHTRLYLTPDLNQYCDVPEKSILACERPPTGFIILWVQPGARIHSVGVRSGPAEFLTGELQNTFQPRSLRSGRLRAIRAAVAGDGEDSLCICEGPTPGYQTPACPAGSCGMCPGTFSDCPAA